MNAISGQPQPACQVWRARLLRPLAVWIRTALGLLLAATTGAAESPAQKPPGGLADMTIEQLMNEPVTAVSKKETKLSESPAAISVITQEDIRRSGLTSLPELLRTVPGLDVVRINASQWAVSSRGFNNQYANKLLVLVDGRAVYTNYWNSPVEGSGVLTARPFSLTPALSRWERIHGPSAAISAPEPVPGEGR
jgi:iron complex outermembrane recepter protein